MNKAFATQSAIAILAGLFVAACVTPVRIRNVAAQVTAIPAARPVEGGLRVLYWLHDHEADPVDILAGFAVGAADCDRLRRALSTTSGRALLPERMGFLPLEPLPGNAHHLSGLTGGPDLPGRPHLLDWAVPGEIDQDDIVCVYLVPDDRNGGLGDPALSQNFAVGDGFGDLDTDAGQPSWEDAE